MGKKMTTYEKVDIIARFVADRSYSDSSSGYTGLVVAGSGDCWASTGAIIFMSEQSGLKAWQRNGNKDSGAGSGHMNAMVSDGIKYYEVEAGFVGQAPRYYSIIERKSLYSYRNIDDDSIEIKQFDGEQYPENYEIPSMINDKKVTEIGNMFIHKHPLVTGNWNIVSITIPNTVEVIKSKAFSECKALEDISIPDSVKEIGDFALGYDPKMKSVKIPNSVTKIGNEAFGYSFGSSAFSDFTIYGYKNTEAERYALKNGFTFVSIDNKNLLGDIDNNGIVNAKDRVCLVRYLSKWKDYHSVTSAYADLNNDRKIDTKDRIILARHIAKWKGYELLPYFQ